MSFLGGVEHRDVLQVGATRPVVAVILVLAVFATALLLIDRGALIPEQDASLADRAAVPTIATPAEDSALPTSPSAPPPSLADSSESVIATPTSELTGALDVDPEIVVRIPIPAELAEWYERDSGKMEFHEWLERLPRDSVWADSVETDFRDFINSKSELLNIRVLSIECRTNACEILAIGYEESAFRTWMEGMSELFADDTWLQDRFEGSGEAGCGGGQMAPGIVALGCTFQARELEAEQLDDVDEIGDTLLTEPAGAEAEDLDQIPLSEAMARLREGDREYAEIHQQMERESTDYSWSVFMETQLTEYLTSLPSLTDTSIVMVRCRTSFCEIQATASGDQAFPRLIIEMPLFHQQSWHDLHTASLTMGEIGRDQYGVLWMLQRGEAIEPSD
jgi:hypothetical protein